MYDARWRAADASGNAYNGALLYIYDAGTTTLSTIWSDSGLSVAASNPLTADANGFFPQFYVAEGTLYDIKPKTSGGVSLSRDALSVAGIGNQTGALVRDFTTSRFQARGAGGTTFLEAGDPTGDDVGGTMTLGGWNNTQADLITVNAATLNLVGRLTENGYKIEGVVRTAATTFTAVTSVDIQLVNDPTGVLVWDIDISNFKLSTTAVGITVRFSYDGGSTFVSTATYYSVLALADQAATPAITTVQTAATSGQIISAANTTSPVSISGMMKMRVMTPNSGGDSTTLLGDATFFSSTGNLGVTRFGVTNNTGGRATHVRLICGSGTFTGVYRTRPQRGFGE